MEKSKKGVRLVRFNDHLKRILKDPRFRKVFERPDDDPFLEVAYRIVKLRTDAGLSQRRLARRLGVSQQAIARLESLSYRGHSLATLQRVAEALNSRVHVEFVPAKGQPE